MDRTVELLEVVLPALLRHLPLGDVLSLSRTCKALRRAVQGAHRPLRLRALVLCSRSSRLVLLKPCTGEVLQHASASPPLQDGEQEGLGSWPPCVEVDADGRRCFVTQYEGGCLLEYSLPRLQLRRRISCQQLAGPGATLSEPEGVVVAHGSIYVAWLHDMCISATPLEALDPTPPPALPALPVLPPTHAGWPAAVAAAGSAGAHEGALAQQAAGGRSAQQQAAGGRSAQQQAAGGRSAQQQAARGRSAQQPPVQQGAVRPQQQAQRQRSQRRPPGQAQWILWGMRLGPDSALYAAANPPYASEGDCYGALPQETGRGFVARLALGDQGQLRGNMARFTRGSLLSRPSGLCFDDAGDLYVTHMNCQVVKFGGPHRGEAAGQPLSVFIECLLPHHHLTPNPQAFRPCPMDVCHHQGLFFLTTHTTKEEEPTHGCLSIWDRQGRLVAAHALGQDCRHPNGLAVFCEAA